MQGMRKGRHTESSTSCRRRKGDDEQRGERDGVGRTERGREVGMERRGTDGRW